MTANFLKKYGSLRASFDGIGLAKLSNGDEVEAQFTLGQRQDCQLLFGAELSSPPWEIPSGQAIDGLAGKLLDGRPVELAGPIYVKESGFTVMEEDVTNRLIGYPSEWRIGSRDFDHPASITFDLTNFLFLGTEIETFVKGDTTQSVLARMPLNLRGREVILRRVADYDEAEVTLRAQRGIEITCTAQVSVGNSSEVDEVMATIETLCALMSIARGTLVNWTSFGIRDPEDNFVFLAYRNSVTRNYLGSGLIPDNHRDQTKSFIERGFVRYQELDEDLKPLRVARAYVETRGGAFIETRSIQIGILAEYLASVLARLQDKASFMDAERFTRGLDTLKEKVQQALQETYPGLSGDEIQAVLNKLNDFNRRSLKRKLSNLLDWLQLDIDSDELKHFVNTRNHLAHTADFPKELPASEHYRRMLHFLDRIILRLLDYHGLYYDIAHNTIAEI